MRICLLVPCLLAALYADSTAGLRWTAPAGWKNEGAKPMRAATYSVQDNGECAVYFFGAGQGGGVEANIDRWKGQFQQPGGKPAAAQVRKKAVKGLPVTVVDIAGEYSGMGGPMAGEKSLKPGYRLLGAIVEGPGGNIFFKFTGPAKTIAANQQKFDQLLESLQKE